MQNSNMHNKILGNKAENITKIYYEKLGWLFVAQNIVEKGSEIDLVMTKTSDIGGKPVEELLFIEVKAMLVENKEKLTPEDNFTRSKQRYFKRGVELYLTKNKLNNSNIRIRIDLVCLYYNKTKDVWNIKIYDNIILE